MASSEWIYVNSGGATQFTEGGDADATTQRVNSGVFRRKMFVDIRGLGSYSIPSDLGEQSEGAALEAYLGNIVIRPELILTSSARVYVCTQDDHTPAQSDGFPVLVREQTWEKIVEPESYEWPETT